MKIRVSLTDAREWLTLTAKRFGIAGKVEIGSRDAGFMLQSAGGPGRRDLTSFRLTAREVAAGLEIADQLLDIASRTGATLDNGAMIITAEQAAALRVAYRHLYDYTNGAAHRRITGAELALDKAPPIFPLIEIRPSAAELREKGYTEASIAKTVASGNAAVV